MQFVSGFAWIYTLLLSSLLWRLCLSTAEPCTTLPQPTLHIYWKSTDSVTLVCRSPEDQQGLVFTLYRFRDMVDSQKLQSSASEVQFTVRMTEGDPDAPQLFCCLYKKDGCFSAFSPYLNLHQQTDAAPSPPSFPPPHLSVEPSSGVVKRGDVLSFSCSVPALPRGSQSGFKSKPPTFLLLRTAERTGATSVTHQPQASRVASSEPQPGVFTLGPVMGGEQGEYTCMYQITTNRRPVNSTTSNMVQVTISDILPPPTFVLQQQTDVWRLLCTGSASYAGAVFSVYLVDSEHPVATQQANAIYHHACFPIPVQDTPVASYRCQYSVLLGSSWSHSERSPPLVVTKEILSVSTPGESVVDWPLVLGSFAAVVLFLCSATLMVVVAQRRAKAAAGKKKKRQEAKLWPQVHASDHAVDLTLRPSSFSFQEWVGGDNETPPAPPLWNSLSTFTAAIYPH